MTKIRIDVMGLGVIGRRHVTSIAKGLIQGAEHTAVLDRTTRKEQWVKENLGDHVKLFTDLEEFLSFKLIDAVIIATPHPYHTEPTIKAFKEGLHVLLEKPAGVYTKEVPLMNEFAHKSGKVFGMIFNQRLNPLFIKLKDIVSSGKLGEIRLNN
ncbi:Gfo/Idh/MocA family protein [Pallidibacillus pasinlerensis]|uniref:Gfo/Idh/MocA family oxidoreductase n=1 Tax=Pallidibacillus pasinlerensis TaxID=2703818 RepID=A0ABX0A5M4_9BACI|nr:Gfo/Idh/MocA family oxidoreductase [Pallidibacillus pasinlerensis]NCU17811.1 Gfo/Idh/MocA family oxidoreductase [Pallidibacillus pasinlerensis]